MKQPRSTLGATRRLLWDLRLPLALGVLCALVAETAVALLPKLHQMLVDDVLTARTTSYTTILLAYAGAAAAIVTLRWLGSRLAVTLSSRFEQGMKQRYFSAVIHQTPAELEHAGTHAATSRLSSDIPDLGRTYVAPSVSAWVNAPLVLVYAVAVTWVVDWRVMLVLAALSAVVVFVPMLHSRRRGRHDAASAGASAEYAAHSAALLDGHRMVSPQTRPQFEQVHTMAAAQTADRQRWLAMGATTHRTLTQALTALLYIASGGLAAWLSLRGQLSVGQVVAAVAYSTGFLAPLAALARSLPSISSSSTARREVDAFIASVPLAADDVSRASAPSLTVTMRAFTVEPDEPYARTYSRIFEPGTRTLLHGKPGSGKTMLVEALNLIRPTSGVLRFGPVAPTLADRHLTMLASETPVVFPSDFTSNVTLFGSRAFAPRRLDRLRDAFPGAESVMVATNCSELSDEQKQFVTACRLAVFNPPVVLLDDPFSAMSPQLQHIMTRALLASLAGTVIATSDGPGAIDGEFDEVAPLPTHS